MNKIGNKIIDIDSSIVDKTVWLKDIVGSFILIKVLDLYDLNIGFPTREIKGEVLQDSDSGHKMGEIDEWMLQVSELYEFKESM